MSSNKEQPPASLPEFLINFPFKNTIPNGPYGPYFKTINVLSSLAEFPEYKTSTLEKNYIWQPHFGPEVGIKLDLFDAESVVIADQSQHQKLDALDKRVLHNIKSDGKKGGNGKLKYIDQDTKPWWLRNTYYMENNPFNTASKGKEEDLVMKSKETKQKFTDPSKDIFSKAFADHSFVAVKDTIGKLHFQKQNATKKMLWSCPVLPFAYPNANEFDEIKLHSLVRYDEDPVIHLLSNPTGEAIPTVASLPPNEYARKKRRVADNLIVNMRNSLFNDDSGKTGKTLDVTVVVSKAQKEEDEQQQQQEEEAQRMNKANGNNKRKKERNEVDDLLGDDDTDDEEEEDKEVEHKVEEKAIHTKIAEEEQEGQSEGRKLYEWLKDFRMEIQDRNLEDSFMILLPQQAEGQGDMIASYFPVHSRIDLKKLNVDASEPHDCAVLRQ